MSHDKVRHSLRRLYPLRTRTAYYVKQALRPDLAAGLTVALVAIPQGMSYAAIAGVNPLYGLHTAIIPAIIGALFGSSHHLITGPTNATALATAIRIRQSANGCHDLNVPSGLVTLVLKSIHHVLNVGNTP